MKTALEHRPRDLQQVSESAPGDLRLLPGPAPGITWVTPLWVAPTCLETWPGCGRAVMWLNITGFDTRGDFTAPPQHENAGPATAQHPGS